MRLSLRLCSSSSADGAGTDAASGIRLFLSAAGGVGGGVAAAGRMRRQQGASPSPDGAAGRSLLATVAGAMPSFFGRYRRICITASDCGPGAGSSRSADCSSRSGALTVSSISS